MVTATLSKEYRTRFSIAEDGTAGRDLLGRVSDLALDWFVGLPHETNDAEPDIEHDQIEELAYQRFQMELPHSTSAGFRLQVEVNLSTWGGPLAVRIESRFLEIGMEPLPANLLAGPPSLVEKLFDAFDCRRGNDRLSARTTTVTPDTAEDFANDRILNPQRTLPIVALAQDWREEYPVSPKWLQARLAGLAEVATYDGDTAEELIRHLGSQLACYNGAVRVYQPGFTRQDSYNQHPFWMPAQARALRQQAPRLRVYAFTRHFVELSDDREFEDVRRQVRQQRFVSQQVEAATAPLHRQLRDRERELESLNQQLESTSQETIEKREILHSLHQQLLGLDRDVESLRKDLNNAVGQARTSAVEIKQLHQQQIERDERIESMRQRLENAIAESSTLAVETIQLHSRLQEDDHQVETLRQELEEAIQKMASRENEITAAHQRLQKHDQEIEQCRTELEEANSNPGIMGHTREKAIDQLRKHLEERRKELDNLRQLAVKAANGSDDIRNLIDEFSAGLSQRDTDIETLNKLMVSVDLGLDASVSIGTELRRELEEREQELEMMRRQFAEVRQRHQEFEAAITELRGEEEEREHEIASISSLLDETRQQTISPDHRVIQLEQEMKASEQLLNEGADKLRIAQERIQELEQQIEGKDESIRDLSAKNSELALALSVIQSPVMPEYPEELPQFENIHDTVELADQYFGDVRFLRSAYKSAEDYPFERPDEVYRAFSLLQELATERSQGTLGKRIEDWMQERGCDYSPRESEATMNEHWQTRSFDGIVMEEHIKIGSGTANKQHYIRIHFAWGEKEKKFIVGHVGEHLPLAGG